MKNGAVQSIFRKKNGKRGTANGSWPISASAGTAICSENEGCFVGEIAYRYDSGFQAYIVNLLVEAKHRGKGYGRQGLRLLLETAEANGITRLCDTIAADNPAVALFLDSGFTEVWRNDDCIMVEYAR